MHTDTCNNMVPTVLYTPAVCSYTKHPSQDRYTVTLSPGLIVARHLAMHSWTELKSGLNQDQTTVMK